MSIVEIISVATAVLSLGISFFLVFRDKKQSQFDLLMTFYDRLQSANAELQLATDTNMSQKLRMKVDSELEIACFMLYKKKLNRALFYHLYKRWLMARYQEIEANKNLHQYLGKPYTIWTIKYGFQKRYLPQRESNKFLGEMTKYVTSVAQNAGDGVEK